jgi:hypothetical protein
LETTITIQGLGKNRSSIIPPIDVTNVLITPNPLSFPLYTGIGGLIFRDVRLAAEIYGIKADATFGMVSFENCCIVSSINTNGLVYFDGGAAAGGWYIYMKDNEVSNSGTTPTIHFRRDTEFILEQNRIIQYGVGGTIDAVYLTAPSGAIQVLKSNMIQVLGGHASTGLCLDSSAATNVTMIGNLTNTTPGVNCTAVVGTIDSNSVLAADFMVT